MAVESFKLSPHQRRKIFAMLRTIQWPIEDLRDLVEVATRQRHISTLTRVGGNAVIDELTKIANTERLERPHPSKNQENKIYKLGYILNWNTTAIRKFNKRINGNWDIQDNTPRQASKLIMAMEGVIRDEKKHH